METNVAARVVRHGYASHIWTPVSKFLAARTALAKWPSENWTSGLQKMAIIRALSLELLRIRSLTFGNVERIADA
jgi:hypothetical protein